MITEDDKVFLKEGFSITPDGGDEVTYAEAFRQLSNKDGKGWEVLMPSGALGQSRRLLGVFKTDTKGLVAMYVSTSLYDFYFYRVDIERGVLVYFATYSSGSEQKTNAQAIATSCRDTLYLGMESGYIYSFTIGDKSVSANSIYTGDTRCYYGLANLHNEFLIAYNAGYTSTVSLFKINPTTGALTERNSKTFSNQRGYVVQVASFVEKMGNKVTLALTHVGEVYWIANMTDTLHASWFQRNTGMSSNESEWNQIAYSSQADLVYYGTPKGDYAVSNARCTPLDGDAGPTFLTGKFPVTTGIGGCSWYNVNDVAFFSPGNLANTAVYYRFNPTNRSWEPFKKGNSSYGLSGFGSRIRAESMGLRTGDGSLVLANHGGGNSGLTTEYVFYVSKDTVSVEIDGDNVNGLSNYMRIK